MAPVSVGLLATGSYVPVNEVSNKEVAERTGTTTEWIERKTQIRSRRYAAADEATSDLAIRASRDALERSGIGISRISYIIVSTSTGDSPQPPTSYLVQDALGAYDAACFDINVVCSGFVYGLELARGLIALRPDSCALVVAADLYSRFLDFSDHRTAVLLGDGAGAAVVGAVPAPYGIMDVSLSSMGNARQLIWVEAGGSRKPTSHETVAGGGHYFRMDGRGVRDFVMNHVPLAIKDLADRAGVGLEQIRHFVPHQPNGVLLTELIERAGLTRASTARTLERYGNIGSASLPVALDDANRSQLLGDGDVVLLAAFGGGMSIGVCLLRWSPSAEGQSR
jgi:3-oxoacyl-(acyl-carrier-protein) synthase III